LGDFPPFFQGYLIKQLFEEYRQDHFLLFQVLELAVEEELGGQQEEEAVVLALPLAAEVEFAVGRKSRLVA